MEYGTLSPFPNSGRTLSPSPTGGVVPEKRDPLPSTLSPSPKSGVLSQSLLPMVVYLLLLSPPVVQSLTLSSLVVCCKYLVPLTNRW
jgi:hypothetical protein